MEKKNDTENKRLGINHAQISFDFSMISIWVLKGSFFLYKKTILQPKSKSSQHYPKNTMSKILTNKKLFNSITGGKINPTDKEMECPIFL